MNHTPSTDPAEQERLTALFANFVLSQTNFAMLMLGKVPHPETGEFIHDLQSARLFIDQLEMIEIRTKGNLSPDEAKLIANSLTTLRLAFVEAVQNPPAENPAPQPPTQEVGEGEESKKRFSKKY